MRERRSLAEALDLPSKAIEFIKHGLPSTEQQQTAAQVNFEDNQIREIPEEPATLVELDSTSESPKKTRPKKDKAVRTDASEPMPLTTPAVSITIRFKQMTAEALRRASLERKLVGISPSSQQDMVELAVSEWLKDNEYLR